MSYNYSAPQVYYPQNYEKKSGAPLVGLGFAAGSIAGGINASKKIPLYVRKGDVEDTFAKAVHDKYIRKAASESDKALDKQLSTVIKKIGKIKKPEDLKALLKKNPEVESMISKDLVENITETTLESNKATIKNSVLAKSKEHLQATKNKIISCWDAKAKKFAENPAVENKTYKIITGTAEKLKTGAVAKAALIWGAVTATAVAIVRKLVNIKKNQKVQ